MGKVHSLGEVWLKIQVKSGITPSLAITTHTKVPNDRFRYGRAQLHVNLTDAWTRKEEVQGGKIKLLTRYRQRKESQNRFLEQTNQNEEIICWQRYQYLRTINQNKQPTSYQSKLCDRARQNKKLASQGRRSVWESNPWTLASITRVISQFQLNNSTLSNGILKIQKIGSRLYLTPAIRLWQENRSTQIEK